MYSTVHQLISPKILAAYWCFRGATPPKNGETVRCNRHCNDRSSPSYIRPITSKDRAEPTPAQYRHSPTKQEINHQQTVRKNCTVSTVPYKIGNQLTGSPANCDIPSRNHLCPISEVCVSPEIMPLPLTR